MIALIAGPCPPPRAFQGLGLPYLAAVLEAGGFAVRIYDLYPASPDTNDPAVLDERLAEAIAQENPSVVGMTIHTPAYAERVRLAASLRRRLPRALLVAGGHLPSAAPACLLRHSEFDACAIGEGEETLLDIARAAANSRADPSDVFRGLRGVVYKQASRIVRNPARPPVCDLDSLPFPAHHLLGLEKYAPHPNLGIVGTALLTYRGCPKDCVFCHNPQGRRVRRRSPSKVVDEMERVVARFGVRGFNVYDNLFGLNREHAAAVCEEILRRRLDVVWDCWTAGDLVDADLAGRMKAAGCLRVGFGAESGDDEVLARSGRGFTSAQHLAGLRALKAAGLSAFPFFMIGLPGETEESIRRTVEFAASCGAAEICLSLHRPYPGTGVWRRPRAFGVRIVRGPNFEAYVETERLPRVAMLDAAERARDELKRRGLMPGDFLRCDRYAWE